MAPPTRRRSRISAPKIFSIYSAGFYGQDEWRVRPNFTLTLAMRFDRNSNISCKVGCFNEIQGGSFNQIAHNVTTPYNRSFGRVCTQAFPAVEPVVLAPRIGFAYTVSPKTVVRGGFGIFSDLYQALIADRLSPIPRR